MDLNILNIFGDIAKYNNQLINNNKHKLDLGSDVLCQLECSKNIQLDNVIETTIIKGDVKKIKKYVKFLTRIRKAELDDCDLLRISFLLYVYGYHKHPSIIYLINDNMRTILSNIEHLIFKYNIRINVIFDINDVIYNVGCLSTEFLLLDFYLSLIGYSMITNNKCIRFKKYNNIKYKD